MGNYDKIGGGYVHYNYLHYLNNGLSTDRNVKTVFSPSEILNYQVEAFKSKKINSLRNSNVTERTELENRLNYFFKDNPTDAAGNSIDFGITASEKEQYEEEIKRVLGNIIQSYRGTTGAIDFSTLGYDVSQSAQGLLQSFSALSTKTNETINRLGSVKRRLSALVQLRRQLLSSVTISKQSQNIINSIDSFFKEYQAAVKEITQVLSSGSKTANQYYDFHVFQNANGESNFIKDLNTLCSQAKSTALTTILKILGEDGAGLFTTIIQQRLSGMAHNEVMDFLSTINFTNKKGSSSEARIGVVGNNTSLKLLNTKNFSFDPNKKHNIDINKLYRSGALAVNETDNKIDLQIDLGNDTPINASIKNVDLSYPYGIDILKGTSFLKLLQDYGLFVNHYLNITGVNSDYTNSNIAYRTGLIQQANKIALLMMAFHGLVGNVYGKSGSTFGYSDNADIFIVNDHVAGGGFKVYYMQDIMNFIADNLNNIFSYVYLKGFNLDTTWDSSWVGHEPNYSDAYRRINSLLMQLNMAQIQMSISPAVLSQL